MLLLRTVLISLVTTFTTTAAFSAECESLRLQVESYWEVAKGKTSVPFNLIPMALSTKNPTTTMPQLALVCRKDSNPGSVAIFGDGVPYNATLSANECRLVFVLGVKTISAEASDDVIAEKVCGTFDIIR
ncbi:hypothetical protein [Roseibium sp.]|uniref:hypothetical protein n=1 Tax=Roseibium sp. TaxID=1936156 RepID=UPI003B5056A2